MQLFQINQYSFTYPLASKPALQDIMLTLEEGKFYVLCGKSGCGKSTLLRQFKTVLAPKGTVTGKIYFCGKSLEEISRKEQSAKIGFVFQNPDNQIVTDKVWHELAFGLESLGYSSKQIHLRVAEMAAYFGITDWFHRDVSELSGGQKQLLNLAAVMAMQPKVLILDEPTSQLDPVAAFDFLNTLRQINIEFGTTILLSEHNLENVASIADRIMVMEEGRIIAEGTVRQIGEMLRDGHHAMYQAMPTPMRIYASTDSQQECPYTVAMGRRWLSKEMQNRNASCIPAAEEKVAGQLGKEVSYKNERKEYVAQKQSGKKEVILQVKGVCFRYDQNMPDILRDMSFQVRKGEILALMGGNGSGKSTTLHLMAGLLKPYRGEIWIKGKVLRKYSAQELYHGILGVLPQDPTSLFVKKTVEEELADISRDKTKEKEVVATTRIASLLQRHPFDLSGGEQQRVALAKVLLQSPEILLLDEPTKGFDAQYKKEFGELLQGLKSLGKTLVIVSHDIEFCAQYADRAGMLFDREVTAIQDARTFFSGNHFYTTVANRMARDFFPDAITAEEVSKCINNMSSLHTTEADVTRTEISEQDIPKENISVQNISEPNMSEQNISEEISSRAAGISENRADASFSWKFLLAMLLLVPATIWCGIAFFGDRKYLLISILIAIYGTVPFLGLFDRKKAEVRKLVIIAVLTALAVAGRAAFYMVPSVKPMAAIAIVAGISLGAESGFLVGALSMLVSNMLFGQGPWTSWQMFAMGLIGFFAGVIFYEERLSKKRIWMCLYGFCAVILLYGGIMNPASLVMMSYEITLESLLAIYLSGLPLDLVHALSTAVFLFLAGEPLLEKIKRVKLSTMTK